MVKRFAKVEIYSPGIVIFDPSVLVSFLRNNNVVGDNIFELFLADEVVGRSAIDEGILIPIYQIPEAEYSVFLELEDLVPSLEEQKFSYEGFPLVVKSELIIVADLNALFDWDSDFFLNYKANYDSRLPCNDYLDVTAGFYSVTISGYEGSPSSPNSRGYGLKLTEQKTLPSVSPDSAVHDRDFSL